MSAPLVLGLDTSTRVAVGLARGPERLGSAVRDEPRGHVEHLVPLVQLVCADAGVRVADLERIVVGLGPGPFTGLRVGVVTARVLAAALGLPVHGICSLDVIATDFADTSPGVEFVAATDARRREVYWARYDAAGRRLEGPHVGPPTGVPALPVVGPGADLYPDALAAAAGPRGLDPGVLAVRGPELPDAGGEPLYLRRPDAVAGHRPKPVLGTRNRGPRR